MSIRQSTLYPAHIQMTAKTESAWASANPALLLGEIAVSLTASGSVKGIKIGTGAVWSDTPYQPTIDELSAMSARITALETQLGYFLTLAQAQLDYLNSWTSKLEKEEM